MMYIQCDKLHHFDFRVHQRNDVDTFSIAKDLDNEYYENSLIAKKSGVKFRAFKCNVSVKGINIVGEINIDEN